MHVITLGNMFIIHPLQWHILYLYGICLVYVSLVFRLIFSGRATTVVIHCDCGHCWNHLHIHSEYHTFRIFTLLSSRCQFDHVNTRYVHMYVMQVPTHSQICLNCVELMLILLLENLHI